MTMRHLSETALQQYILDKTECDLSVHQHIQNCESCRAQAAVYESLFAAIKEQPAPAFDFDLSGLVLKQTTPKKAVFPSGFILFILAIICPFGIIVYLFRSYILELFTGNVAMVLYLVLATVLAVLAFQTIDTIKRFNKRMSALNY